MKSLFEALASAFARLDGGSSVRSANGGGFASCDDDFANAGAFLGVEMTSALPSPSLQSSATAPATPPSSRGGHYRDGMEIFHPLPLPKIPEGRLTVVLDLDETLVAAYPEPAPRAPRSWRRGPSQSLVVGDVDLGDGRSGDVRCYLRPGLHAFLRGVSEVADVVLYTAGLPGYASPLCDALDPSRALLPVRLFRQTTVAAGGHSCVKDLSPLGRDLRRTVLVDNSPFSFLLQPACGLPAHPFDGDGADDHLLSSVLPLLRELAADPGLDVRPLLSARFGMASWLAARGGWALYEAPCGNLAVATGYCAPTGSVPAPRAPATPERKGGGGLVAAAASAAAAAEQQQQCPRRGKADAEEEFGDLSDNSCGSSWRPSTPTTTQAQEHQRPSHLRHLIGAAASVDSGPPEPEPAVVEEDERMMPIEVAA